MERCLIFAEGARVEPADLPELGTAAAPAETLSLDEVERRHIERTLVQLEGNKTRAAQVLGIDRATLYAKLKRYGL